MRQQEKTRSLVLTMSDKDGTAKATLNIPEEVRAKYPDLIELIIHSESMNNEERQYWVNILPIMTPEQVQNLTEILVNEKKQLAAIDKKYAKEIENIGSEQLLKKTEQERSRRRSEREERESAAAHEEEQHAENILEQINES